MKTSKQDSLQNTSGLIPVGIAVLVKPVLNELKTDRIILPPSVGERSMMIETDAIVIAIGPDAWKDRTPRAEVGDRVMVSRWCGHLRLGADGVIYKFINADDIFGQVTKVNDNVR